MPCRRYCGDDPGGKLFLKGSHSSSLKYDFSVENQATKEKKSYFVEVVVDGRIISYRLPNLRARPCNDMRPTKKTGVSKYAICLLI